MKKVWRLFLGLSWGFCFLPVAHTRPIFPADVLMGFLIGKLFTASQTRKTWSF